MISLMKFNLKYVFTKKYKISILIFFILFSLFQAYRLNSIFRIYKVNGGLLDYLIFTLGGMESPFSFSFILNWIFIIFNFIHISIISSNYFNELTTFALNRVNNRFKFWITLCFNQLILSTVLFIILFIICFIVGVISFGLDLNWSEYTKLFYSNWYSFDLFNVGAYTCLIFISGIYSLQMIIQLVVLFCDNTTNLFIGFLILSIVTGIGYFYFKIPRFFAPLFYPSTFSLSPVNIINVLIVNLLVSIICVILGYLSFRKKDLK